jgi:pimeloyl-ACP methyl ester carboxylesterase
MTGRVESYTRDGLTFEVTDTGPLDGRVVIMLHGFPEDRHGWSALSEPLIDAGYRVLAPDQRGYSTTANPAGRRSFTVDELCADVLALADTAGAGQVDVVGHDWGAVVAWALAAQHADRTRSLCALSVPHPRAVAGSLLRSSQALRSWYMVFFQLPAVPERVLALRRGAFLEDGLVRSGLDRPTAARYSARAAVPANLTGPLNWYRALPYAARTRLGRVGIPTLYIWGDKERFVSRTAAESCGAWVRGSYRFVVLPGRTHWLPTTATGEIAPLLLEHLATFPT